MPTLTPFLWFNDNAEDAANFYLSIFPGAKKISEVRSKGVGTWPEGAVAIVTLELLGQRVTFLNGGPAHKLSEAFSFFIACKDQAEIDEYWARLTEGGSEGRCGWLKDKFDVSWQVVPENIGALISHPKGMEAMMKMKKLDTGALEAAAKE